LSIVALVPKLRFATQTFEDGVPNLVRC
jgi:hypothetical protein